jgi:hypothetical protein
MNIGLQPAGHYNQEHTILNFCIFQYKENA